MLKKIINMSFAITIFFSCTNFTINEANEIQKILTPVLISKITQYGITWKFDKGYTCGQFANGDYWIIGPVRITSITPEYNGINNGWEINPMPGRYQGFEYGAQNFNPELVPALPYTAKPGESIVKSISKFPGKRDDCYDCCLKTAAVLTVVANIPMDNGITVFRPPYVGKSKPYYSLKQLQTSLLPSLKPIINRPSLDKIIKRFRRVQLEHCFGRTGRIIRPEENMQSYGPNNACDKNDAILRLMLDDSIDDKMPALITVLQNGIDTYHAIINGQTWPAGGGYEPGHKLLLTFTAAMLNNEGMKNVVRNSTFFTEDHGVYRSRVTGKVLYGFPLNEGSWKTRKDSNEIIDAPGGGYIHCCLAMPWKGSVLAVRLMPALQKIWYGPEWEELSEFVDRWVAFGRWYPVDKNDNRKSEKAIGEKLLRDLHGTDANAGYRDTTFQKAMWEKYQ